MATVRKFSAAVLNHLKKEHPENAFKVSFVNGHWRPAQFSLRRQADIRKACMLTKVDPKTIGMPALPKKKKMQKKPAKGHKQQRTYAEKQAMIQKNLEDMPEKIRKWKEELEKEKAKTKSTLPF
ncbi:hypothetical protein BX661DRAFT_199556 [Kickxella alabastrina]|uniref:Uncharacterized protein n=1 Tax=Kickxella alabastrina TaxID=61397 RepID=A0ACC1IVM4_9FUNG|nr:uncharacterized protein BX661DRAFT_199556 [Kickxella alabastrina]KAI7825033.1 hypothetical protein BX661DRAFT_199556 [Kickxella alabastrina]KAJ1901644.1 hypothetical protein LPJ66_000611 [Kickxella alabastrina]KAJ1941611.1 hypothetical protein GGF37_003473 [Kickxella alabastrina]